MPLVSDLVRRTTIQTPFTPASKDTLYLGINICPTDSAMQQMVQDIINELLGPHNLHNEGKWIEYLNLFTFYTVWMFGIVTGARPIICPYLSLADVNKFTNAARFKDKSDGKARLVWIIELLRDQMKLYENYLGKTRLGLLTDYPCRLVDKQGAPLIVQPSTLEPFLQRFLPGYPSNIHRRWMFNALLDSGCPVVPEWTGHARVGGQLTGRAATASPYSVGVELAQLPRANSELSRTQADSWET